jgi:hypothetical protein
MKHAGQKQAEMARRLGRAPSTISRELSRNGSRDGYQAAAAHRRRFGDGEGDTLVGAGRRGGAVSLVERKSGYLLLGRATNLQPPTGRDVHLPPRQRVFPCWRQFLPPATPPIRPQNAWFIPRRGGEQAVSKRCPPAKWNRWQGLLLSAHDPTAQSDLVLSDLYGSPLCRETAPLHRRKLSS